MQMKKISILILLTLLVNSCNIIEPYWNKYFGKKDPNKEEVLLDQKPPPGYDPIFIIGEKSIDGIVNEPKLSISRVETSGDKVKVFFHISDESLLLQGAENKKEIWCDVYDTLNGKATKIENFKIKEVTEEEKSNLAIAIVMDHSGSMGDERARVMQNAIAQFLRKKFPNDLVSLIRYDNETNIITKPLASEMDLLAAHQINGLEGMGGGTKTVLAIDKAVEQLKSVNNKYQKLVMVFTDGINSDISGMNTLIEKAVKNNTIISAVDYGYNVTPNFLDVIANKTNGIYHHIYLTDEFKLVFDDLYYRMNNYYVLEYDNQDFGNHSIFFRACLPEKNVEASYSYNNIPLAGDIVLLNVYFDTGQYALKKESKTALDRLEKLLKIMPNASIRIQGHTDNVGNPESNQKLSQNRAEAVKQEMIKRGIRSNRIMTAGYGARIPVASNDTPDGRAKNRRVEFIIEK